MTPEDLIRVELAKKTAKSIVDHGSIPMATLKESIKLHDKVNELLAKEIQFPEVQPFPEIPEVDFTHLEEKINEVLTETKKKDLLEYDLQIDEKTRKKLKGDKGDNYILTEKDKREIAGNIKVPLVEKVVETIVKEVNVYETPEEVVTKLESLKGNDRLSVKAIKGLDRILDEVKTQGKQFVGSNARFLSLLLDVQLTTPTNGQALVYDSVLQKYKNATISGAGSNFVDEETPTGIQNGVNTIFTLGQNPITGSAKLFLNGIRLKSGGDYTISGLTLTMLNVPVSTDVFFADYRY